jgi:hypothetical protein
LWGIGRPKPKAAMAANDLNKLEPEEAEFTEPEMSESEPETETEDNTSQQGEPRPDSNMEVDDADSEDSTTPTPQTYLGITNDEDLDDDEEVIDFNITGIFNFSPAQLGQIRTCIRDISLPTWVARPPKNLGESKHGKLKAYEYLMLFTVIFPLVIPELWYGEDPLQTKLLENFNDLVASTNIISSFSTSNTEADQFTAHYVQYRAALPQLFPLPEFHSLPNHHFAMHNGALLKFWGPLAALNEFAGERMNGMFQKVKHNRRVGESSQFFSHLFTHY